MAARNISIFSVSWRNKQKINVGLLNPFRYSIQVFFGIAVEKFVLTVFVSSAASSLCATLASGAPYRCAYFSISHRLNESQGLWCG